MFIQQISANAPLSPAVYWGSEAGAGPPWSWPSPSLRWQGGSAARSQPASEACPLHPELLPSGSEPHPLGPTHSDHIKLLLTGSSMKYSHYKYSTHPELHVACVCECCSLCCVTMRWWDVRHCGGGVGLV